MKKNINKIVVSGGNGRFATVLRKTINSKNYYFPSKSQMNILNLNSLEKYLKLKKPKYFMHVAALSRPMSIHDKEISKSRHRTSFMPDQDVSDQDNEIKDIANVVWTDAVKTAWNNEKTKRESS